jgi:hypothetical protein
VLERGENKRSQREGNKEEIESGRKRSRYL